MDSKDIKFYEVGGAVRDRLMGVDPNDIHDVDFSVTAPSFEAMRQHLIDLGFRIWKVQEDKLTIRAAVPEGHPLRQRTRDADFVMARREGSYTDGRRPDWVEPGTLEDDLARRDFTVNAIAIGPDGDYVDPHGGIEDIRTRTLRFVGDPLDRITDDGLRVVRALRFMATKGFTLAPETEEAMRSPEAVEMLSRISKERISDEIGRMMEHDTIAGLGVVMQFPEYHEAMFRDGLHLTTSLRRRRIG